MAVGQRGTQILIEYESEAFPPSRRISLSGDLSVTWGDLLWAAVTLGRPALHYVFGHGRGSRYEAIFRWSLIRLALEQRSPFGSRLWRTDAFKSLDPTEKGSINYFIGMTFCKLFADKLLGTPWLLHLDVFREQLNPRILRSRSRPDLVGLETASNVWHVFESKGRASIPGAGEKTKAKAQARRLVSIDGAACGLHVGAITYFKNDVLRFFWRDPEPEEPNKLIPIQVKLPNRAWRDYFEPIVDVMRSRSETRSAEGMVPRMFKVHGADVEVGAHPKLVPLLLDRDWEGAHQAARHLSQVFLKEGYQSDGLLVKSGPTWRQPLRGGTID